MKYRFLLTTRTIMASEHVAMCETVLQFDTKDEAEEVIEKLLDRSGSDGLTHFILRFY